MSVRALVVCAALLLPAAGARASGFLLYEQSARAMAMGSAVSAGVRDPSAVWFDPAALAFMDAGGVSAMAAVVTSSARFSPADASPAVDTAGGAHFVPNLFAHARVAPAWQVGLGLYAPFGFVVQWPEGWVGAEQSLSTDLAVLAANPVVAWRASNRLSVAVGATVARGIVTLVTALPPMAGGRADLSGGAWGVGGNVAVLFRLRPEVLHLSASYHSRIRLAFSGDADFSPQNPGWAQTFFDQRAHATITLPDVLSAGAMWRPHPQLELGAQIDWALWSAFDELDIRFEKSPLRTQVARGDVNPLTFRAGAEWRWRSGLAARAGASFDQSAVQPGSLAPAAPDSDRLSLCAGLGYAFDRFALSLGYLFAHFLPADASGPDVKPQGTYRADGHALSLSLDVSFR